MVDPNIWTKLLLKECVWFVFTWLEKNRQVLRNSCAVRVPQ